MSTIFRSYGTMHVVRDEKPYLASRDVILVTALCGTTRLFRKTRDEPWTHDGVPNCVKCTFQDEPAQ